MAITLEKSDSLDTEETVEPKPVAGKQAFANLLLNKVIKGVSWDPTTNDDWLRVGFSDGSVLAIARDFKGLYLRFVPPGKKK